MRRIFKPLIFALALLIGAYSLTSAQMRIDGGIGRVVRYAISFTRDAIGVTSTDGLVLNNGTAAAAGAQQMSPRLRFDGFGWKTDATATSQAVSMVQELLPVEGASAPTANLLWRYSVNGGAYSTIATLRSSGDMVVGNLETTTNVDSGFRYRLSGSTFISLTAPTIASGGCTSPAVTSANGTVAFLLTIGTSCTGVKTITLTMPAAPRFWACSGHNHTSDAAQQTNYIVPRATSTTAVVLTSYDRATGLQEDFTASDTYLISCIGE